jgi:hypothetical protein
LNVESYGRDFAQQMGQIMTAKLRGAREVKLAEMDQRSYLEKLRDSFVRLFSPYL